MLQTEKVVANRGPQIIIPTETSNSARYRDNLSFSPENVPSGHKKEEKDDFQLNSKQKMFTPRPDTHVSKESAKNLSTGLVTIQDGQDQQESRPQTIEVYSTNKISNLETPKPFEDRKKSSG
jgi:hypothetical protein